MDPKYQPAADNIRTVQKTLSLQDQMRSGSRRDSRAQWNERELSRRIEHPFPNRR